MEGKVKIFPILAIFYMKNIKKDKKSVFSITASYNEFNSYRKRKIMSILNLLIVGLIAGFLADKVVKNSFGLAGDLLIGVIGSFLGSWLFSLLNLGVGGFLGEIFVAFIGAVVLLLAINMLRGRK